MRKRAAILPSAVILTILCLLYLGQSSIPAKYDGFSYGDGSGPSTIVIEAFFDPLCPDSRDAWPPLKTILHDYSPHLSLIVHPFPLPYHDNSYLSCRALHIANKLNESATYPLLESFFKYQRKYSNSPTRDRSRASIIEDMAKFAALSVGNSLLPAFESGFEDPATDLAARVSFKALYNLSPPIFLKWPTTDNNCMLHNLGASSSQNQFPLYPLKNPHCYS